MIKFPSLLLPVLALASLPALAEDKPVALTPSDIVAAAPKDEWTAIAPADLLVIDLTPGTNGKPRRTVIQLAPAPFGQGWVGNIRKLAAARWWDGLSVYRVQDNYVVQWGDPDGDDKAKAKPLPYGLSTVPESEYVVPDQTPARRLPFRDAYAAQIGLSASGWPFAGNGRAAWPLHCYGAVGVARDLSPNTGSGSDLYVVIGHAPRQLDRNIAVVGRVIEGIENLSSLPRGTGNLGFYESAAERVTIASVRIGSEAMDLPSYEYLKPASPSFARYAALRANRSDAFYRVPAGGVDICNLPVPIRRTKTE